MDAARLASGGAGSANSSISDTGLYPSFCQLAAKDDRVFKRFRRSSIYTEILEHTSVEQGQLYLQEIERHTDLARIPSAVFTGDVAGGPRKQQFDRIGAVSPSTLRYLKVATDLERLFGSLAGLRVGEIGVGYGGQCRVVTTMWETSSYLLFDIPEVLSLAHRYLTASGVDNSKVTGVDGRSPAPAEVDLVISNYAFSELHRDVQESYLERVIKGSPRGYVTYNHISAPELRSLTAEEFAARIPGASIVPEQPETYDGNVLVLWGEKDS
jgi:hypothetical protein